MTIRAVCLDVGETLVDETRMWGAWADHLGVSRLTLFGVLGGVIERGEHHHRAFEIVRPGVRLAEEREAMRRAGTLPRIEARDFYPDALPCLAALKARGVRVGLAGNQPEEAEDELRALGLPVDFVASSARWGVEKPSPAFFQRLVREVGAPPGETAYVGDRVDNDVAPAADAGMVAILLKRGPWGHLHASRSEARRARAVIASLAELPGLIG